MIGRKGNLEKLEEIKKIILCLLISNGSQECTLSRLNRIYKEAIDEEIPFQEFNYTSLKDFLNSMSDVFYLSYNKNNELCVHHDESEKSQHISNLVKKQKKSSRSERGCSKYVNRSNLIDPSILFQVLKHAMFKISFNHKNKRCVRKIDVLSKINDYFDVRTFYTMTELTSQLHELTHLLTHDDDYIYFKEELTTNANSLNTSTPKSKLQMKSVSDFVKESTKLRLQKLVEKYPEGIWCHDLPKIYLNEFKLDLEYSDLGFNSIIEFIEAIPETLQIIVSPVTQKLLVIDTRIFNNLESLESCQKFNVNVVHKTGDSTDDELKFTPAKVSSMLDQLLTIDDTVNFNESVDQIHVNSIHKAGKSLKVIVTEVDNPSYFWVILHKNKPDLKTLMNELQDFYNSQDLSQFSAPQTILKRGLHIASKFSGTWHRGIVTKVGSINLKIFFYDFGTIFKCKKEEIYLLDRRFTHLPAQAILCGLSNVKPQKNAGMKWPCEISKLFMEKVLNKQFYAYVSSIDEESNSMLVNLITRNYVLVNEWMIREKLARHGEVVCLKKNISFKFY